MGQSRSPRAAPTRFLQARCGSALGRSDAEFEEKETLVWSIFNPEDWNKEVPLGWRWAPAELKRMREAEAAKTRNA